MFGITLVRFWRRSKVTVVSPRQSMLREHHQRRVHEYQQKIVSYVSHQDKAHYTVKVFEPYSLDIIMLNELQMTTKLTYSRDMLHVYEHSQFSSDPHRIWFTLLEELPSPKVTTTIEECGSEHQ